MKVAIYGKTIDSEHKNEMIFLFQYLKERNIHFLVHKNITSNLFEFGAIDLENTPQFETHSDLSKNVDYLFSIGGDGTILDTILLIKDLDIPVLGINTGRLGFISNTPTSDIKFAIDSLLNKDFKIEKRSLLRLEDENNLFGEDNHALNEISIMKSDSSSMITIHTELDGKHLNSYWTDGLIISTATGSTAYSLSCGGPILMPGSGNFVITPIAPHNLNVRPIVVDDDSVLTISVESRAEKNRVALDSRSKELNNNNLLIIQKADYKISLIQLNNQSFIQSLRNKLNWGLDKRNK